MQTIEQRARSYVEGCELQDKEARKAEFDYIVGAKEEHILLTEWKDVSRESPKFRGWYLVKLYYEFEGEPDTVYLTAYWNDNYWMDDHIDFYKGCEYENTKVTHWRPIHECELPKYYGDDDGRAE